MSGGKDLFARLSQELSGCEAAQMFGKACLKVAGKAFLAQHLDDIAFKLGQPEHEAALAITGAKLWDPSSKGRPMKEWIAIPALTEANFALFAKAAKSHVMEACHG